MQTLGFNVEWSQELTLEQSLEEYVKAAMLIRILEASGRLALAPGCGARAATLCWLGGVGLGVPCAVSNTSLTARATDSPE